MKKTLFILPVLFAILAVLPTSIHAQTFTVNYQNRTVEQIIKDLREKTGYQFVYKKETVENLGVFSCNYKSITLKQLLDRLFYEEMGLDYEISKGTVILRKASDNRPYYKRVITGIVTDSNDEPLAGATVRVRDTGIGVATDLEGTFTLSVEGKDPQLEVSYVGMKTKIISARTKNDKPLFVKLDTDEKLLEELIVTGYQNIKRENATGSYQLIGSRELERRHTTDLVSRLEGQIPGLSIYNNGTKGNGEASMVIRGAGSFQAKTSPLIVVDGLPIEGSIETVNSYDIENITVLKDASAASIYGARASNGVIVITTKRAHSDKLQADFNADLTVFERRHYGNRRWASASQTLDLEKYNFDNVCANTEMYNSLLNSFNTDPKSLSPAIRLMLQHKLGQVSDVDYLSVMDFWRSNDYTDEWRDVMLRTQIQHQYNLALRNKGKKLRSSIVLNYQGDNMGMKGEEAHTFRMNYLGEIAVAPWLDLMLGVNLISERTKIHAVNTYNRVYSFLPYQSMRNADGTLAEMEAGAWLGLPSLQDTSLGLKSESYNLLNEVNRNFTNSRRNNIRSFVHANLKVLPELSISAKFQYEDIIYKGETYLEGDSYYMRHLYNLFTSGGRHYLPDGGMLRSNHQNGDYYTFRSQANYGRTFVEKHAVEAIAGLEYRQTHNRYANNLLLGYDDRTQTNMNHLINFYDLKDLTSSDLGAFYSPSGSAPSESDFSTQDILHRFYSLYFNANYTYDSRYSASFSYRVDKADLFGADPEFRGRPLWSVGAGWNIANETFMKSIEWIDALKLRAGYGLTGNIDQSVSSYLTAAIAVNEINGKKGATLNTPPNDQLRWEKTASWNVGIDFSFLHNRLSGSIDGYIKNSSDLLTLTDIDPTTGWSSLTINNGKARNTGVELQIDAAFLEAKSHNDLGFSTSFSFAYNKNEVVKVDHLPTSGYEALKTIHEGRPINSLHSYRFAGMQTDANGVQSYGWIDASGKVHSSDVASGEFSVHDIVFSGGLDPKVTAGLTPEITWKGWSLSAMFAYYGGHYMRAAMEDWGHQGSHLGFGGYSGNMDEQVPAAYLGYWTATDRSKAIANGSMGINTIGSPNYADHTVMRADFLTIRNVMLGYSFPKSLCAKMGIAGLRLRIQMNNVAKWVKNDLGIDPEAVDPLGGYAIDSPRRSYTMGLSLNF